MGNIKINRLKKNNKMGNTLDKNGVLDRIKKHYQLKGNADLARFLGVAPNLLLIGMDEIALI